MTDTSDKKKAIISVLKFIMAVLIVMLIVTLVRMFIANPYVIPSGSMENTILEQDYIISEKVSYSFLNETPQPGDIVTFDDPVERKNAEKAGTGTTKTRTLIKRVIATEGQTVDMRDGSVYIDGEKLDEPYAKGSSEPLEEHATGTTITYPYTIPSGEIWVMGDNREHSADSRYFGSVPTDYITGKAITRYWPLNRFGTLY